MNISGRTLRRLHRSQTALTIVTALTAFTLYQVGIVDGRTAVILFLCLELPMLLVFGTLTVVRFRRLPRPGTFFGRLDAIAAEEPLLRYPVTEVKLLVSIVRVTVDRRSDPAAFGYVRGTLTVPAAFGVASLIELVVVHLLVPWPWLRVVLLVATVYGMVLMAGVFASRVDNPHRVSSESVELNWGLERMTDIPVGAIERVVRASDHSRTTTTVDGDILVLAAMSSTNVRIELNRPVPVSGGTPVTTVLLAVSEPREFVDAVSSSLDSAATAGQ